MNEEATGPDLSAAKPLRICTIWQTKAIAKRRVYDSCCFAVQPSSEMSARIARELVREPQHPAFIGCRVVRVKIDIGIRAGWRCGRYYRSVLVHMGDGANWLKRSVGRFISGGCLRRRTGP